MNAYNELDGVPCAADHELLTDAAARGVGLRRAAWSPTTSRSARSTEYHRLAEDGSSAAAMALNAGLDVELPSTDCYGRAAARGALDSGLVDEATLDRAVGRVLRAKFELGLFEQPFVDADRAHDDGGYTRAPRARATIARKSLVLLRNDGTLPLASQPRIGRRDRPERRRAREPVRRLRYPAHVESLREVLETGRARCSSLGAARRSSTLGDDCRRDRRCSMRCATRLGGACALRARLRRQRRRRATASTRRSRSRRGSDVAVLVMGDKAGLTDDCTSGESRDRASLDLPGVQEELVARRRRHRHAGRARARRRPARTAAQAARAAARPCCSRGSRARRGPRRSPTTLHRRA